MYETMVFTMNIFDSIIYVQSKDDGNIKPVLAEHFDKVEKCENLDSWTSNDELLTDPKSFPNCYMVTKELGELENIDFHRVVCKGLMVQYYDGHLEQQRAVFPMGVFDHD